MTDFSLHPYQKEMVERAFTDWFAYQRLLFQSPTGTGKTLIQLAIAEEFLRRHPNAAINIHIHSDELGTQPLERAEQFFPQLREKMGVVMGDRDDVDAQIAVCSVMTLRRKNRRERLRIPALVLDDECHRSIGRTRRDLLLDYYDKALVAGFTAWPYRTDKQRMGHVFDHLSYSWTLQEAIEQGYLSPFKALGFSLPVSFKGVKQSKQGEFDADHAASLIDATNIFQIVLEKWREFGSRMQTIAFAPNVASAVHMAQFFRDNGERWEAITHLTPKNERRRILDDFRAGKVQGVVNKSVFTEGADFPAAKCLVNLAPTASSLVVAQRLGRVLRLHPSHPEAQVLDFAPTDVRLVLPQDVLAGKEVEEKEATVRAAEAGVEIWAISASKKGVGVIDPSAVQVEILDYMKGSRLPWSYHKGVAVTALKDSESIVIAPPANERIAKLAAIRHSGKWSDALTELELWLKKFRLYRVYKHGVDPLTGKGGKWVTELVGTYDTGREAGRAATSRADVVADQLGHRQAQWRKAPASEPQIGFLRKLGADPNIVADIESDEKRGKGRASRMIDGILRYKNYSQEEERIIRAVYRGGESLEEQAVGWPAVKEKEVEYGV